MSKCDFKKFINEIEIVEREIRARFGEFNNIDGISFFINSPFEQNLNIAEISTKISKLFDANQSETELEIIKIQNNIHLKSISQEVVWKYTYEKFPILTSIAQHFFACFGSTYLSEYAFSNMTYIKIKVRNKITKDHLDQCLRLATPGVSNLLACTGHI